MSAKVIDLNDSNFNSEVLQASQPVLVQFAAEWSCSCQTMAGDLNSLAEEALETVKVGQVDVDRSPTLATRHGVRAIPTVLVFHEGTVRDQIVGPATAAQMRDALETAASADRI